MVDYRVFRTDFWLNILSSFLCHERSLPCRLGYSVLVPQRHGQRVQQRQASRRQQDRGASVNSSVAPEVGGPRLGRESRRRCWRWCGGGVRACPGLSGAGRQRCERQQVAVVNVPPRQLGDDTEWGPPRYAVQRALQGSGERSCAYPAQAAPETEVGTGPLPALCAASDTLRNYRLKNLIFRVIASTVTHTCRCAVTHQHVIPHTYRS